MRYKVNVRCPKCARAHSYWSDDPIERRRCPDAPHVEDMAEVRRRGDEQAREAGMVEVAPGYWRKP